MKITVAIMYVTKSGALIKIAQIYDRDLLRQVARAAVFEAALAASTREELEHAVKLRRILEPITGAAYRAD